jgi:hypothetical protein
MTEKECRRIRIVTKSVMCTDQAATATNLLAQTHDGVVAASRQISVTGVYYDC